MASNPAPETHFEAWGQAVYRMKSNDPKAVVRSGIIVLFAIADINHQWLGWYKYSWASMPGVIFPVAAVDLVLLRSAHEVLAEGSAFPSHFVTNKPITVEELCGPVLYERGRSARGGNVGDPRRALLLRGHHQMRSDTMDLSLTINSTHAETGHVLTSLDLYMKRKQRQDLNDHDNFREGFVEYVMSEPFGHNPIAGLNVARRLHAFEHNLTSS